MNKFVDVSHSVEHGMITYRGLPAPVIGDYLSREASREHYAEGTTFQIGKIEMVSNTGTYIDAPFHRHEKGKDLSALELPSVADLDGIVIRVGATSRSIGPEVFGSLDLKGKAVLFHTGWDIRWNTAAYFEDHPFISRRTAEILEEADAALVGIDSLNIDDTSDGSRPAHSILLGADIPIVEHLCNLGELPDNGFKFFAVPVKVVGCGSFPVRAFGIIET